MAIETRIDRNAQPGLMECIAPFSIGNDAVGMGERLPEGDRLVKAMPSHFRPADASDSEKADARWQHTLGAANEQLLKDAPPPPPPPPAAPRIGAMEVASGPYTVPDPAGKRGTTRLLNPGDRYPVDHELVKRYGHVFRPVIEQR
jgi:hypothetical protein